MVVKDFIRYRAGRRERVMVRSDIWLHWLLLCIDCRRKDNPTAEHR